MLLLSQRISDRRVLKLCRKWLRAGVMEDGTIRESLAGRRRRGDLAAVCQHLPRRFRPHVATTLQPFGDIGAYADDFVCCVGGSRRRMRRYVRSTHDAAARPGASSGKDAIGQLVAGKERFEFLGWTVRKRRSVQRCRICTLCSAGHLRGRCSKSGVAFTS